VNTDTYLDEGPSLVIVPEAIAEPVSETIVEQVSPPSPGFTEEMSDGQFAVAFWRYLMEAKSPDDLLARMGELTRGLGPGSITLGEEIPVNPDSATRRSPEFQARLQRAYDHGRSLADELKSGRAHPSWYTAGKPFRE
jgi:hypothetical protein